MGWVAIGWDGVGCDGTVEWDGLGLVGMGWGYGANVVIVGLNYSVDGSVDLYLFLIDSGDLETTEKYEMGIKGDIFQL